MDNLWTNCESLAGGTYLNTQVDSLSERSSTLIKPLHLALGLLFDGLHDDADSRLYTTDPELPRSLQLPLFWTAVSQASSIPDDIGSHLREATFKPHSERLLQQCIGQALWQKLKREQDLENRASSDTNHILNRATTGTEIILKRAREICDEYGSERIALHHILLALLEYKELQVILEQWPSLHTKRLPDIVRRLRPITIRSYDTRLFPVLNQWAIDLTHLVKDKKERGEVIDPLIGRCNEMRRLIAILSRRKKNSAVLLGDPGVGKTAIAEGLAQRLVEGVLKVGTGNPNRNQPGVVQGLDQSVGRTMQVPESVVARVFNLDLASLLASTACKSAYEQIVKMILDEIAHHEERGIRAIIFMDNLNQITIGGYRGDGTGLDAATIMKPFLMKGKLRCVGCSTVEDFRMYIEKDGALARQFSPIYVCESTPDQTVEILRGLRDPLQRFHKIAILDDALVAATTIATQFFAHKRLPDSAIDLIDETCAQANLARSTNSETVWRLQRSRVVLKMDMRSLEREVDEESDRRLLEAQTKLYNLDRKIEASSSLKRARRIIRRKLKEVDEKIRTEEDRFTLGSFNNEDERQRAIDRVRDLGIDQDNLRYQLEQADSETFASNLDEFEKNSDPITKEMVAKTAMYYTFIPAAETLDPSEILKVADRLSTVVVGQPEAVEAVANTVQYMWAGFKNPRRPIASFLFGGPSGSGKTLLVKGLSEIALRQSGKLLRINASDYVEPHSLTRLIGTPACTGFDHGGQLTECVRRKPFSVVHIKDIERGCVEFRLLIQTILDEGTIKDGDRNVVDFTNCIIVISTSLGQASVGRAISEETERKRFMNEIESHFPGEFLSRLDKIVIFRRMSGATLVTIIHARLEELRKQLSLINLQLLVHDAVKSRLQFQAALIRVGCARWLDRLIRSEILEPLAKLLLKNDVPENKIVVLAIDEDIRKITVRLVEGGPPIPITEPMPNSPVPSSPSASYCSFDTDEHWEDGSTDSHSVDEEEDEHHYESWAPRSLRPLGPPALSPLPQRLF
ncbi:P-loop containing nucleoside triphosphate hydrolase protein [Suillus fuscotomentosus]|uniref:P-loop containing nucleoside triphosphate hydrolase protein n=1 Tax=Suillus fuscotomentosus TaxID=1912939 RepID=A0AAD4HIJ2_9AGAM|nr:P-loop containing nucleoside triphosphate hydrolase protein [Suillus fuscotomentosus]KAG1896789.1 P-loop containing nucleoside triphosphate hydrolase protein [Suillus fuscotomentosus]